MKVVKREKGVHRGPTGREKGIWTLPPDFIRAIFMSSLREEGRFVSVLGNGRSHLRKKELFMRLLCAGYKMQVISTQSPGKMTAA
jgi:D-arabinose 5-phosphate isomerase GutQ